MRLNGWQRIFVVIGAVWTLCVWAVAWQQWPVEQRIYRPWEQDFHVLAEERSQTLAQFIRASYQWAYHDLDDAELEAAFDAKYPRGSQPSVVSYYTSLAAECCRGVEELSKDKDDGNTEKATVRELPGVGRVAFPGSMSSQEVDRRAKELVELREKNDRELRNVYVGQRASVLKLTTAVWLGPLLALYAGGWAIAWIRRGFKSSH